MPNCDICTKAFGVESCLNIDDDNPKPVRLPTEGGVTGRYGMIEAAFFYCYTCWKAALDTVYNTNGERSAQVEDVKKVARQMVVHRVRGT